MSETTYSYSGAVTEQKKRFLLFDVVVRLVREKPLGTVGGIIVLIMLIVGIFADVLAPYGIYDIHLVDRLSAPSATYFMGTDDLGRDLLSRVIYGARISMLVGVTASAINVVVATVIGIMSGFIGGRFDLVVQRFVDAIMCFPWLFILLTAMAILGPGLVQVILVLGVLYGIAYSRVVRSAVIAIKENLYMQAAVAIGSPTTRILVKHVLPNILAPIIIIFTISMASMILAEASLSFLGFGVPPPTPTWGSMLSMEGRRFMLLAPWLAIWPGLALSVTVYGINMLGDAVRDLLDPRLRGGAGRYGGLGKRKGRQKKTA